MEMLTTVRLVLTGLFCGIALLACGKENGPSAPTRPAPPGITGIAISGTASFTAANQTTQLQALASFSDGTTRNVTQESVWRSSDPLIATVSGTGLVTAVAPGTVQISATYNERTASIEATVASACAYTLSQETRIFAAAGGVDSVDISTSRPDCGWSAGSDSSWVSIQSGSSGAGAGSVRYYVAPYSGTSERRAAITVADRRLTIVQSGASCVYAVSPTGASVSASGGTLSFSALASPGDCQWRATSNQSWVAILAGQNGQGNMPVTYTVSANTGANSRTAQITVAGLSGVNPPAIYTVTQAGAPASCNYGLTSPKQETFGSGGGNGVVTFTQTGGTNCSWTASVPSTFPWITLATTSGTGHISIRYTVAANTGTSQREGRIEVRWPGPQVGENISVVQAGR